MMSIDLLLIHELSKKKRIICEIRRNKMGDINVCHNFY